jgi:hypothetical protein
MNFLEKKISAILLIYPAKLSFTSNYYPLRTELESAYSFSYDREIDGSDTLLLAHNYIISELSKVGISATADLV